MPTEDYIAAVEDFATETLRTGLAAHFPSEPIVARPYAGEMGVQDVMGVLEELVQRAPHVMVAFMGLSDTGESDDGRMEIVRLKLSAYVAARNLRGAHDQQLAAYPIMVATRRVLRAVDDVLLGGQLPDGTSWQALVQRIRPDGVANVASMPGIACYQVNFACRLKTLWN